MAPATGKEDGLQYLLNSNPASFKTVKSLADKRIRKVYVNLMVINSTRMWPELYPEV